MRMPVLIGLLTVAATITAGCASAQTGAGSTATISRASPPGTSPANLPGTSPGSPPASPPPGSPGAGFACGPSSAPAAGGHVLTLTSAQDGKTYCVTAGTSVLVLLKGTPVNRWGKIRASGGALRPSANGRLALMTGVTGASFRAVRPGASVISSARSCGSGGTPGDTPCDAAGTFRATVIVRAS